MIHCCHLRSEDTKLNVILKKLYSQDDTEEDDDSWIDFKNWMDTTPI